MDVLNLLGKLEIRIDQPLETILESLDTKLKPQIDETKRIEVLRKVYEAYGCEALDSLSVELKILSHYNLSQYSPLKEIRERLDRTIDSSMDPLRKNQLINKIEDSLKKNRNAAKGFEPEKAVLTPIHEEPVEKSGEVEILTLLNENPFVRYCALSVGLVFLYLIFASLIDFVSEYPGRSLDVGASILFVFAILITGFIKYFSMQKKGESGRDEGLYYSTIAANISIWMMLLIAFDFSVAHGMILDIGIAFKIYIGIFYGLALLINVFSIIKGQSLVSIETKAENTLPIKEN